ncbi:alpha/beta hydrolase [Rhodoferax sp.]|uniref:alpha/beta fold hydrolase n=1 Tax=Rhodoferax sp. TaxID=50421 RepID=UPI0025D0D6B1|nr:alpha/beta hydrolase [Rhodoferax sp.]
MPAHRLIDKAGACAQEVRFTSDDHTVLVAQAWGNAGHRPVILLHGGGQTRHAWKTTARNLAARGFYAIAVDLRGHGDSGWSPSGKYSMDGFVADLRCIAKTCRQPPVVIGASLGGITGLVCEGEGPPLMAALVLVDVTPTVQQTGIEKIRLFMGAQAKEGFASVEAAADSIAAYLPHRPRPRSLAGLGKNLRQHADGRYRWHWDPALLDFSDQSLTAALSTRLTAAARGLKAPVLLVRGGASELVSTADVEQFLKLVPHARYANVADAGHMVAGDVNDQFGIAVLDFLLKLPDT